MSENVVVDCRMLNAFEDDFVSEMLPKRVVLSAAMLVAFSGSLAKVMDFSVGSSSGYFGNELVLSSDDEDTVAPIVSFYANCGFDSIVLNSASDAACYMVQLYDEKAGLPLVEALLEFFANGIAGSVEGVSRESVVSLLRVLRDSTAVTID